MVEAFLTGLAGGAVPAIVLIIVYVCTLAGRLAKIETNICWLMKELSGCRLRSNDRTE